LPEERSGVAVDFVGPGVFRLWCSVDPLLWRPRTHIVRPTAEGVAAADVIGG
jgi:hypothetical protein